MVICVYGNEGGHDREARWKGGHADLGGGTGD